jgi:hypothetical protein
MELRLKTCFVALLATVLYGCGSMQPMIPVTDAVVPIKAIGFSVLPPAPEGWFKLQDLPRNWVVFASVQSSERQIDTVMVIATLFKAVRHDIRTSDGLYSEYTEAIKDEKPRVTQVSQKVQSYRDDELDTDCLRIEIVTEERNNPHYAAGKVLLRIDTGKICRHTLNPVLAVSVLCSERRPSDVPSIMNESIRKECAHSIDSLKFLPVQ